MSSSKRGLVRKAVPKGVVTTLPGRPVSLYAGRDGAPHVWCDPLDREQWDVLVVTNHTMVPDECVHLFGWTNPESITTYHLFRVPVPDEPPPPAAGGNPEDRVVDARRREVEVRRRKVRELHDKGWTGAQIATKLCIPNTTVAADIRTFSK